MAEGNEGADNTQNKSEGSDAPFKAFANEDEFKQFESKTFSAGYNNYQEKALGRLGKALGGEFTSLDEIESQVGELKTKLAEGITDPTATEEYKQLQKTNQELKGQVDSLSTEKQQIQMQYSVDSQIAKGLGELKTGYKLRIDEPDVQALFKSKHKIEQVDGKLVAKQFDETIGDFRPITDENGNYKPVSAVFAEFGKKYADPAQQGTGGETGGASGGSGKVKRSEFAKALKSNQAKAAQMLQQGQKHGWIEDRV